MSTPHRGLLSYTGSNRNICVTHLTSVCEEEVAVFKQSVDVAQCRTTSAAEGPETEASPRRDRVQAEGDSDCDRAQTFSASDLPLSPSSQSKEQEAPSNEPVCGWEVQPWASRPQHLQEGRGLPRPELSQTGWTWPHGVEPALPPGAPLPPQLEGGVTLGRTLRSRDKEPREEGPQLPVQLSQGRPHGLFRLASAGLQLQEKARATPQLVPTQGSGMQEPAVTGPTAKARATTSRFTAAGA
uniref:Uncharacterized protein n=1 Tax=Rangifer tarandus platyrhynchus TaxID=3082113 RepID=A0ACB0DWP0_RANTA|nr:unnamed protein product [Rangifer tarandus platyrhynchus]